jgi:hypothetical protein
MPLPALLVVAGVFSGIYLLLSSCTRSMRQKLIQKQTGMADIPFVGIARPKDSKLRGTAVVCGGR